MGVGLKPHLPDGTYTGTYRVISADTHIVYGGLVFDIGHPGAAPRYTVAGLIGRNEAGRVTKIAFGVVRTLDYLSIALMIGGLLFMQVGVGACAGRRSAGPEPRWSAASAAFARRSRPLLAAAVVLGLLVSLLGVLLQGATAAGVSLWSSLKARDPRRHARKPLRLGVGTARARLAAARRAPARGTSRRPGPRAAAFGTRVRGADGRSGQPGSRRPPAVAARGARARLRLPRAHPGARRSREHRRARRACSSRSDVLHVLAASVWVGGIACLLLALPAATRRLEGRERTRLLFGGLRRFSPMALAAVIAIAATGVIQAYIDVRSSARACCTRTYGALIIAKTVCCWRP